MPPGPHRPESFRKVGPGWTARLEQARQSVRQNAAKPALRRGMPDWVPDWVPVLPRLVALPKPCPLVATFATCGLPPYHLTFGSTPPF